MALEDSLTNQQYKDMLNKVKEFSRISLSYTYVYGYKSHGYDHAEDVVATLEKLLDCYHQYKQTLSEEEICVLLMACYLHDIGMIIRNDNEYKDVRQFHNEIGWRYIEKYGKEIGIDSRILNKVRDICYAHSNFRDNVGNLVDTLDNKLPDHPSIAAGNRNLAVLVRIANMFALKINPLAIIPQTLFFQKVTEDKDKWLMRKQLTEVSFSAPGEVHFTVNWNVDSNITLSDIYRVKLSICRLVKDLENQLRECRKYLPPRIEFRVISSNLEEYHQSLDGQQQNMASLIAGSIQKGTTWLLNQKEDAWGTLKETRPRVATTAKSVICLLDHSNPQDINSFKTQILDSFRWALEQHDPSQGGFPAKTLEDYSQSIVHCTAMAIYAYALLCEKGILHHAENSDEAKKMQQAVNWLLRTKQRNGWGNWEEQPVRPLPTYWALRALKRIEPYIAPESQIDFAKELNAFAEHIDLQRTESLATSCFLLILSRELLNASEYSEFRSKALRNVINIFDKRLEHGLWTDEIEEYHIYKNKEITISLRWTHHILALAIHALSVNKGLLGVDNLTELLYESILALINNQNVDGNFDFVPPNMNNKVTPTYEALNSLNKALDSLF